ncbi:hypothetical protein DdX_08513 [Ditylenchus destructor]|uniref:Uncharacterized protein n=1 Tax=Ditylenchus destructor TaxID=166010 RepID=A0AAD4N7H7_9BILA|nr:hypothetical protein DdX_08513 [Ditylenchus destructor]
MNTKAVKLYSPPLFSFHNTTFFIAHYRFSTTVSLQELICEIHSISNQTQVGDKRKPERAQPKERQRVVVATAAEFSLFAASQPPFYILLQGSSGKCCSPNQFSCVVDFTTATAMVAMPVYSIVSVCGVIPQEIWNIFPLLALLFGHKALQTYLLIEIYVNIRGFWPQFWISFTYRQADYTLISREAFRNRETKDGL